METGITRERIELDIAFSGLVDAEVKFTRFGTDDEFVVQDGVLVYSDREDPTQRYLMYDYSGEHDAMVWIPEDRIRVLEIMHTEPDAMVWIPEDKVKVSEIPQEGELDG